MRQDLIEIMLQCLCEDASVCTKDMLFMANEVYGLELTKEEVETNMKVLKSEFDELFHETLNMFEYKDVLIICFDSELYRFEK